MENFIKNFATQLLDQEINNISAETIFRDLDDWDSLTAMAVIAMVEDEYGVKISDDDFEKLKTIQDMYDFVMLHK
jgi:acyl carrier protein